MKFIKLGKIIADEEIKNFANLLLEKHIQNDKLFESLYFPLTIHPDSLVQMFYRTFWTDTYLRRGEHTYPDIVDIHEHDDLFNELPPEDESIVYLSISECINYIHMATPSTLQDKIPENIKSIESIWKLMHFFLFEEDNPQRKMYNISTFYSVFHMEIFDTNYKPDFKKFAMLRKMIQTYDIENYGTMLGIVDTSTRSISDIMEKVPDQRGMMYGHIHMSFHVDTEEDFQILYDFLRSNFFTINGLYCEDIGLFVSASTDTIQYDVATYITSIYSQLMKK